LAMPAAAQSTINPTNHHAWSANTGWLDFRPERPNAGDGFRFGEFSCSGWLWSPNLGWVDCGDGSPANGISYGNTDASDFGVNHYGTGDLYGLAWAPNAGWINFGWWTLDPANTNRPRVDLGTGRFAGYAWSANCGWIALGSGQLKTDRMAVTDTDGDGISDAFEIAYTGGLTNMTADSDTDGDGQSDKAEYIALTNPLGTNDVFRITRISQLTGVNAVELEWPSSPARVYGIEAKPNVTDTNWIFLGDVPGAPGVNRTMQAVETGVPQTFFRLKAKVPLQP
ncbi:MAG TPA: thrombospondin type 3 repeat-containing protein, partial [Methylomirabilota bacterium]|nr:thrombospondin type 3 repeat-containing protein [Methylomirabilota bacterium]